MQLALQRKADIPVYRQIVQQIREQIRQGTLRDGERLPPVRQLASDCGLTRLTVHSAYAELQAEGLVQSHVGRGTFVTGSALLAPAGEGNVQPSGWVSQGILANLLRESERRDLRSFAQAFPAPETYPGRELGRALQAAALEERACGYGHIQGEPALREELSALLRERGMAVAPDRLLVTSGAQQAIDVALRALSRPGDVVLVEEPVYPGVLELAALRGQRVVGIPNRNGVLDLAALEAACVAHRPRLLYLVPTYNNPTGRSLASESRATVLRLAARHDLFVLEDDTYGFLGLDGVVPPALGAEDRHERVVYLLSFSKMLAPALRLGAITAPLALLPALEAAKHSSDLVCSALMQRALAHYLRGGHLTAHLREIRTLYRARRDAMLAGLQRHLAPCRWTEPEGGLSLWVDLPPGISERDFTADALTHGVGLAPGAAFFARPRQQGALRLSFGTHGPKEIEAGMAVLGEVLASHLPRRDALSALAGGAAGPLV